MTNNNITSQSRLRVDYIYANLRQWFAVHCFVLKQFFNGSNQNIVAHCSIQNQRTIVYKRDLAFSDPLYLESLTSFANKFDIRLQVDRRIQDVPVMHDRRSRSLIVVLLGLVMINNSVSAANDIASHDYKNKQQIQQKNTAQLLNWIRFKMSELEFEVGYELPNIQRLPASEMYELAFGDNIPRVSSQPSAKIYGLYNYKDKTIYLLDSIDINTTKGRSILLHELVHYLQYKNGHDHKVECKNRLEYLAYSLEAAYLKEHGQKIGFSQNHLRRVVQCHS